MKMLENDEIKQVLESALGILCRTEKEIVDDKAHEQAISARLLFHLQHLLPEWNVDVEFNRQGEKRNPKTDAEGKPRKPDIIIHKRGPDGPNLTVVLVKCEWNKEPREIDEAVVASVVYHSVTLLSRTSLARFTLAKISSAFAVHLNDVGSLLC